ncbi:lipopolysaccharide export system permease protein [Poseidonocella pacifica]|uniref:Lipopolysaccharide export system permease protein n=1 Tax=Poseidonocella pacifica TaxID=871651 RepID=A0A1I0VAA4_9RHOB|nr:LPS export ABC transporter permease LptF [Poseidonocella pacifica]SFA73329.1 lipopolysaccharide export system permease protein [Poseidonocella pacifica]
MGRTDKYLLSQLTVLFGFFALVLVAVYWINRAVVLFDKLVGDGQSARVFLEFSLLSLPAVIAQILPLAAFAGTTYVINRLSSESELTALQATGNSPLRLARPVAIFGVMVAVMMSALTLFLVPMSADRLSDREDEIARNITAKLLTEGVFLHPVKGVTFYIGEITPDAVLRHVFLSDTREATRITTYTASEAYLVRSDEEAAKLVMLEGLAQSLEQDGMRLSTTHFQDFTYDIGALIGEAGDSRPRVGHLPTSMLMFAPDEAVEIARSDPARVRAELHERLQQPLLCIAAALIGFSTLMAGGFSRFGIGPWIILSIFFLIVVQGTLGAITDPVRSTAALWPLAYLPAGVGFAIAGIMLWIAQRGGLHRRARRVAT